MTQKNTWQGFMQINNNRHAELVLASTPLMTVTNKEEILNQVQDDNKRGFTLIELLVVVLIIGILAAVALPQYQKAVEKTRMTEIVSWISSFNRAFQLYVDTNGHSSSNAFVTIFSQNENVLDIDLPYIGISVFWGDGDYYTNRFVPKDGINIIGTSYVHNNGKFRWGCMDCKETGYCQRLSEFSNGLIDIDTCF